MFCIRFVVFLLPFFLVAEVQGYSAGALQLCHQRQVEALRGRCLSFNYRESRYRFYHSAEPWQTINSRRHGRINCDLSSFSKIDTLVRRGKIHQAKIQFSVGELLIQPYRSQQLLDVSRKMVEEQLYKTARYTPIMLLDYFNRQAPTVDSISMAGMAIYELTIHHTIVKLFIRTSDFLLARITCSSYHDMLGDETHTYRFSDYRAIEGLHIAHTIHIGKLHGVQDTIALAAAEFTASAQAALTRPESYLIREEPACRGEVLTDIWNIADRVYLINLPQAKSRAGVIEFDEFLLVFEAPLNSANGEAIIKCCRDIAPDKPIRYYAVGHHHPWSLGGVRPFIHRGATILCRKESLDYLRYIAGASHSLQPDSLELQPMPLRTQLVDSLSIITDGSLELHIHFVGAASLHANDYVYFYLPSAGILFQGDQAWIRRLDGPGTAGKRQKALYDTIRSLRLDVDTIVQHWPTADSYGVKSVFSFRELEASITKE